MKQKSDKDSKTAAFSLYPVHMEIIDRLRGYESRSSFIRRLIEQAAIQKKEQ